MLSYILRRLAYMVVTLLLLSFVSFFLIQLPPGSYIDSVIANMAQSPNGVNQAAIEALVRQYDLDKPFLVQYYRWITNIIFRGDFGRSFQWEKPVGPLLLEFLPSTVIVSLTTLLFSYVVGIMIGVYSATHQYKPGDYAFTVLGFVGMATPDFILALVLLYGAFVLFGGSLLGLFSRAYVDAPWSLAKLWDLAKHLPIPIIVIGLGGTAGLIRVMRATMLDELRKQYVTTARMKGMRERKLLYKYPFRVALNPVISGIGGVFPAIVSGATITSIVLTLPTTGAVLYSALRNQDMYLAGSSLMILSFLSITGTLISDILLVILDPRIKFEKRA